MAMDQSSTIMAEIAAIKLLSTSASNLLAVATKEDHDMQEIVNIVKNDAPLTAKTLKVVNSAAFGLVGLETALALVITKLINVKALTLKQALKKLTIAPAKILGLNKGTLKPGSDADVIVVDPKAEWIVDSKQFVSRSRNTPFNGWKLNGKVVHSIVGGKVVVRDGKLLT